MRTLGVDLAAQAAKTAVCSIEWSDGAARVSLPRLGATDEEIRGLADRHDVIGVDAPFGWPVPFVELLCSQSPSSEVGTPWTADRRDRLRFRLTDYRVRDVLGRWPLSVSSDLIAIAAMRCAGLLNSLGLPKRFGSGRVFEVYPAVALSAWGFASRGYKPRPARVAPVGGGLGALVESFLQACPWLSLSEEAWRFCTQNDDAFDSLVASLVARAAALGLTRCPTAEEAERAAAEGWIEIPLRDSLARLAIG
jgi:hypothetical protein